MYGYIFFVYIYYYVYVLFVQLRKDFYSFKLYMKVAHNNKTLHGCPYLLLQNTLAIYADRKKVIQCIGSRFKSVKIYPNQNLFDMDVGFSYTDWTSTLLKPSHFMFILSSIQFDHGVI